MSKENLQKVLSVKGQKLVEELRTILSLLQTKQLHHGYWDIIGEMSGCLPESRKGATMNLVNNNVYIFGGFSRGTYNDLKVFNINESHWREV